MTINLGNRLGDLSPEEFERAGQEVLGLLKDYYAKIEDVPVLPAIAARELQQLLDSPIPEEGEAFERIVAETRSKVIPNLTLWNHPRYFAYFSTGGSAPGALADLVISALNVNLFLWKTAPAGSALEQVVLRWMAEMLGYDPHADGVLVNGASLATFYALAAAREAAGLDIREQGMVGRELPVLRVYATEHAHSSIDKAVIALGLGLKNLVKIPGDEQHRMQPDKLEAAIRADLAKGYKPIACVAVAGTTSTGSVDPLTRVGEICRQHGLWLHIDAAYGGFYNLVPSIKEQVHDLGVGDSIVANPHKGLFAPLEVTALYSKRKGALAAAFSLVPEYLRTEPQDGSVNYMDFSLQLGRSFRALKLWWIIRTFGRKGLAARMQDHLRLAEELAVRVQAHPDFERISESPYPLVCLRFFPHDLRSEYAGAAPARQQAIRAYLDKVNAAILETVNADGMQFISHSALPDVGYIMRVAIGNIRTTDHHVDELWHRIQAAGAQVDRTLRPTLG